MMLRQAGLPIVDFSAFRSHAFKAFWVLLDQGIFSVSNFIINILFARWLEPVDYGRFVLSFSVCQFVGMLHFGAIQEPLLVQSAQVDWNRRRAYVGSLFRAHVILLAGTGALGFTGWVIAWAAGNADLGWTVACGLVGGIAILTNVIGRRLCFIFISVRASAIVGAIYLAGSVVTGLILHRLGTVWWVDIWFIIGGWSLFASAVTFWMAYRGTSGTQAYPLSEIIAIARRYAHWGLGASICGWVRADGLFMILAHFAGLTAVAETRAIFNMASPLLQANMAVHTSALVGFSADGSRGSKRNVWRIVGFYSLGLAVVVPLTHHYASWLVELFYHGRYVNGAWQLPLYCLVLGLGVMDAIISSVFKARGVMRSGYASIFVTGLVSVTMGPLLIPLTDTLIWVMLLSAACGVGTALLLRMRART